MPQKVGECPYCFEKRRLSMYEGEWVCDACSGEFERDNKDYDKEFDNLFKREDD